MGQRYEQLSLEERCAIARLREAGQSLRQIAAALDRTPSTISRELKRNAAKAGYRPAYADEQAWARRWSGSRLERDEALRETVLDRLADGWSPEQVAGRLALEAGHKVLSHETIYRFVYAQMKRTQNFSWRLYLPRAKTRRGRRRKRDGSPASFIKQRRPIRERPQEAGNRQTSGHWEADFMLFATYGQSVLVAHERATRATFITRTPSRKAKVTTDTLRTLLTPLPKRLRSTMTFDNGTEFALHYRLHQIGVQTFFCDTRSPCKKAASKTPSGALDDICREPPISITSPATKSTQSLAHTTIPPENASTSIPQPRQSQITCCTSNVNPHPDVRQDDAW
jgi:IS30 family transposase